MGIKWGSHWQDSEKGKLLVKEYLERKEAHIKDYIVLRRENDILYDLQDIRKRAVSRELGLPFEVEGLGITPVGSSLKRLEDELTKNLDPILKSLPEWEIFKDIRGVGPRLGSSWISNMMIKYIPVTEEELEQYSEIQQQFKTKTKGGAFLVPIIRGIVAFRYVSSLWMWSGQVPGIRRVRGKGWVTGEGKTVKISDKMQVLAWKQSGQFVRSGAVSKHNPIRGPYRTIYDEHKRYLSEHSKYALALQDPALCPRYVTCSEKLKGAAKRIGRKVKKYPCVGHINNMAKRKMIKEFEKNMFVRWLKFEGLPVPPPYDPSHRHHNKQ